MGRAGLFAAVFVWLAPGALVLGDPPEAKSPSQSFHRYVATIDVSRTFKQCRHFNQKTDHLKSVIHAADEVAKQKSIELYEMAKATHDHSAQSPLQKARDEFQQEIRAQQKDFLRREMAIRATVYREMIRLLIDYCNENGIEIVLNVSEPDWDSGELNCRLCDCQKKIYWYSNEITDQIIERLNSSLSRDSETSENVSGGDD